MTLKKRNRFRSWTGSNAMTVCAYRLQTHAGRFTDDPDDGTAAGAGHWGKPLMRQEKDRTGGADAKRP
jgi:hypothetical protein